MAIQSIKPSSGITVRLKDGTLYKMYEPTEKQLDFHNSSVKNLVAIGSRGSGKSVALRMDAHMRALAIPNCNLIIVRKTMKDLIKSHLLFIEKEMFLLRGDHKGYHGTNYIASYPNGSRLFFSYVGHETDSLNLLGAEFLVAYFDELSTIPWDYFSMLKASVRIAGEFKKLGLKPLIRAATNPYGPSAGEVNRYFVTKEVDPEDDDDYRPQDWNYISMNMEDNPHLDVKEYRRSLTGLPDAVKKAWLDGEFAYENALFSFHPVKDSRPYHVINEIDPEIFKTAQIYRAFDMGYSPDPAYCLWIAHLGNRYIAFQEQVFYKTIAPEIAREMLEKENEFKKLYPGFKVVTTYCDPTIGYQDGNIRTVKDLFEMNGVPMDCSINSRELYSAAIHTALGEEPLPGVPKLQIYVKDKHTGCAYLAKTLPMMQFDPKNPSKLANHKDDHPTVTLAYFLISSSSMDRQEIRQTSVRPWQKEKTGDRWVLGREAVKDNH